MTKTKNIPENEILPTVNLKFPRNKKKLTEQWEKSNNFANYYDQNLKKHIQWNKYS